MRKLAYISLSFSAAVFIYSYLVPSGYAWVLSAFCAAVFLCGLFLKGPARLRILLISGAMAVSFLYCEGYDRIFISHNIIYDETETTQTFTVLDYPEETDYGARVEVKFKNDIGLGVKTRLYLFENYPENLGPGDKIELPVSFSYADELYGEKSDIYFAKGTVLTAYQDGEIQIVENSGSFIYFPKILAEKVKDKISEIFSDDTIPFVLAILTGDTTELSKDENTVSDMKIAGIYHIVAVSGMHISFLVGLFMLLAGNKKKCGYIAIPGILVFMAMTGMRPSVVRAGIMQILLLSSFFTDRDSDTITSISFALLVLLLVNPASCQDVGLQLSFASTFGIILLTPKINKALTEQAIKLKIYKNSVFSKLITGVLGTISASLGATAFSIPLVALYFGYISLISPISNVLIFFAISAAFCLSIVSVALGFVFLPIGKVLAFGAGLIVKYIVFIARIMASFRFSAVYTSNILILVWVFLIYIVIIYMVLRRKKLRDYIVPVCLFASSVCVIFVISPSLMSVGGLTVTALNVGQGSSTLIADEGGVVLIDCGSAGGNDAGEVAVNYLKGFNENFIDVLVLTHYHEDHASGIVKVIENMDVGVILLPEPLPSDLDIYTEIETAAQTAGTDMAFITEDATVYFENSQMTVFAPMGASSENERGLSVLYTKSGYDILITGDMQSETEKLLLDNIDFPDIEILVVGHHGSKYSTCDELLSETTPDIAIVSVGHNSYGHPADEILEKLESRDITIYRTDIDGNVVVRAGG